jgi:hypothetical protein
MFLTVLEVKNLERSTEKVLTITGSRDERVAFNSAAKEPTKEIAAAGSKLVLAAPQTSNKCDVGSTIWRGEKGRNVTKGNSS